MSPYYTVRLPNHNLVYTPSVNLVWNSYVRNYLSMLMVPKSEVEIWNFWKQPWDSWGNGRFATDSQGRIQTSDGDPRTGIFHQTLVTAGDTTCNVNGVLRNVYVLEVTQLWPLKIEVLNYFNYYSLFAYYTLSHLSVSITFEIWLGPQGQSVNILASHLPGWPQVGKLVVACRWSAVYSTEP